MTEVQKYEVVKSYKEFEVRAYAPFITVSTHESGNMLSAGNQAFRKLANFIFGFIGSQKIVFVCMSELKSSFRNEIGL